MSGEPLVEVATEPGTDGSKPPTGLDLVSAVVHRLGGGEAYGGGVNGTCYECPFASAPLDSFGRIADWGEIYNDPTEAYFRCHLPGRPDDVAWGEDAPCNEGEWFAAANAAMGDGTAATVVDLAIALTEARKDDFNPDDAQSVEPRAFDHVRSVRLDAALLDGLRNLAEQRGQTVSDLIRWAVAALVGSGGDAPTVLAAKVARLNREGADARLKRDRARRAGDDLAAARHAIRADTLDDAARLVAGQPEPVDVGRPIETVNPGGLL